MAALRLGELLKAKGLLTDAQLNVAMAQQAITGDLIGDTLIKLGFVSAKEVAQTLSEQAGIEFLNLDGYAIPEKALRLASREIAERTGFLPLDLENGVLSIGITSPSNILAIDTATRLTGKPPRIYMVDSESFYDTLERAYYFLEHPIHHRIDSIINEMKGIESPSATMISSLTELLIMDGIRRNATDIHINPASETVHVLYRIDGVLHHAHCLPKIAQSGVASRIKILSQLDIAEQRLPQDGSFSFSFLRKKYDMRVSTIPTIYGENVVIRILSGTGPLLRISNLGFDEQDTERLRLLFSKPYGIILITGPTGSGKTTTLYAALREINLLEKNVLTVEDPVEYRLSMVRQTEVNEKAGYDFALAGRNFMRQDPDVMLLGEIRDEETARIAIRSSITGHLVLTTLHTNDAVTAIPRLIDLNVDRYLLSSSLLAVIAQRLVRRICTNCKTEYQLRDGALRAIDLPELEGKVKAAFKGRGCAVCNNTGYFGRIAIGEILIVNDEIKELIYSGASVRAIKEIAIRAGMRTLRDDGIRKAIKGITTFGEVVRVAG
jgi:type II secretory ATPase GspE/PulE/Tfp pilus assembly ATPase PilB-like protein